MSELNLSEKALVEVAYLLHPLKSLNTSEQVLLFLERLGYQIPASDLVDSFAPVAGRTEVVIGDVIKLAKADTDEKKVLALVPLLLSIKEALDELGKLKEAIESAPGLAADFVNNAPLDELPERLLDFLIYLNFYKRHPKIFGTLYLLGVLDEEILAKDDAIFQPDCRLKVVRWDRLPMYLSQPGDTFDKLYGWNTDFNSDELVRRFDLFLRAMAVAGGKYKQSDNVKAALDNLTEDLSEIRIPIFSKGVYPDSYSEFGLAITPAEPPAEPPSGKKKGIALLPYLFGATDFAFEISDTWEAVPQFGLSLDAGLGFVIRPPFSIEAFQNILNTAENAGSFESALILRQKKDSSDQLEEFFLFGDSGSTHISTSGISIKFFGSKDSSRQDAGAELEIGVINLLVTMGEGDAFLSKVLPPIGIDADFGLVVGFSFANGVYFKGSASIEIFLPVHIILGPIEIHGITIAARLKDGDIPIEVSTTIKALLGPLLVLVENIGLSSTISFPADGKGELGPVDFNLGFKPPNGVGLALDVGVIKGGGYLYFDFEKEEYAGALELTFSGFLSLKAIGLITTRMPDGSKGFSLLIIITVEFVPGLQLGYGFSLIGVGGLLGLNRRMLLQPLVEGVRTGAVNNILFPQDVIANAPRIISDLRTIFPAHEGTFLIGPMAKLAWGTPPLITLSLGIIIEIPGNIVILGVLKAALPTEEYNVVLFQVSFVGVIEFDKGRVYFFASLYESHLLEFPLDGDMGLLMAWGGEAVFVLSVGGFHPLFAPPPLPFPSPHRLSLTILNEPDARLRVMCYFAVTSNTVQFGALAEAFFQYSEFRVSGFLSFDALLRFSPFYFIVQISASAELKVFGAGLFCIRLRLVLEGPSPWRVSGSGSISLAFFEFDVDLNETWGETQATTLPPIAVIPLLRAEFEKPSNWTGELPSTSNLLVSLRPTDAAAIRKAILEKIPEADRASVEEALNSLRTASAPENIDSIQQMILSKVQPPDQPAVEALLGTARSSAIVIHPIGLLRISQKLVPLEITIDKVGNQKPSDAKRFSLAIADPGLARTGDAMEQYAIAQFQEMDDATKLSQPSFQDLSGGLQLSITGQQLNSTRVVRRVSRYEQIILDTNFKRPVPSLVSFAQGLFTHFLKGASASKSPLSDRYRKQKAPFETQIRTNEEAFTVAYRANNKAVLQTNGQEATFMSHAMARECMNEMIADDPSELENLHVIPKYEVE